MRAHWPISNTAAFNYHFWRIRESQVCASFFRAGQSPINQSQESQAPQDPLCSASSKYLSDAELARLPEMSR